MVTYIRCWAPGSKSLYYNMQREMSHEVRVRADITTMTSTVLPYVKTGITVADEKSTESLDGTSLVFTQESPTKPLELFATKLDNKGFAIGAPEQLTHLNPDSDIYKQVKVEHISWESQDGKFIIHGLLFTPANAWENGKIKVPLPTILSNRGGPSMVSKKFVGDYPQGVELALALHGYAVLVPNTRGRGGYGFKFQEGIADGKSILRLPAQDAMAGIDFLVSQHITDPSRLGIFGHSYGAQLTGYIITQTDRFKAAVDHEGGGLNLTESRFISPQIGQSTLLYRDMCGIHNPLDSMERVSLAEQTALLNANLIKTPTLLIYGNQSNYTWGLPFFNLLRNYKVPCAMFVYKMAHTPTPGSQAIDDARHCIEWLDHWVRNVPFPTERAKTYEAWKTWYGVNN